MNITSHPFALPALSAHGPGCRCALHGRRRALSGLGAAGMLGAGLSLPALVAAQEGVRGDVGRTSRMANLVPAAQVEQEAAKQYAELLREAQAKRALAPADHPQVIRLRAIAARITPFATQWNPRAANWRWEINLIGSEQLNAFCMPGGKIAFFYGILDKLQLTDAEVAMIMGHEMAHALREHAREQMGKSAATQVGVSVLSQVLGMGNLGNAALGIGGQLLGLKFSRDNEEEADLIGMELAARAGYNPEAGISLWEKMTAANRGAPPEFLSTHPSSGGRINEIRNMLPKVLPLYQRAPKPPRDYGPPGAATQNSSAHRRMNVLGGNPNNRPSTPSAPPPPAPTPPSGTVEWGYDGQPRR